MKGKKAEPLPEVEMPDAGELPEGWAIVSLGKCVEILDNLRVPVNNEERKTRQGTIPYYGATGQVGWIDDFLFDEELLLLGEDGAPFTDKLKEIAYIITGKSWVNNHAHVLRARQEITSNSYLKHYLNSFDFSEYITGSTRDKLNQGAMKMIPVPLPPLPEQQRIVARIEALLAHVNEARGRLHRVPGIMKRFRQGVLAAACSGRLPEGWREEKSDADGIGLFDQSGYNSTIPYNFDTFDELPNGWASANLDKIATCRLGKMLDQIKNQGTFTPYIRNVNVRWFGFDLSDIKKIKIEDSERDTYSIQKDDILICEGGEPGRCAIWNGIENEFIFQKAIHRVRVGNNLIPEFLCYCIKDAANSGRLSDFFTGTTIKHLTGVSLKRFSIPLPPVAEQHEIVCRVNALFARADQIERQVVAATKRTEALTQAVLGKAFRGEM